jgi:transposase
MSKRSPVKPAQGVQEFSIIQPDAAGIDVGGASHFVAVPQGRDAQGQDVREFKGFTADLQQMAQWLKECKIKSVALESTGVYWIPVFELLEAEGFEVRLVDAHQTKSMPGRKSDVLDCQWIQQLHTYGLLTAAFRPEQEVCVLRSYLRQRSMLVQYAAQHIQHMQKALAEMNLKLTQVVRDISGVTGLKIIRAIVAGERNPRKLAALRHELCKNPEEIIAKALEGNYREEHIFALQQALQLYDFYQSKLRECDLKIKAQLERFEDRSREAEPLGTAKKKSQGNAPQFDLRSALYRMAGVDLTEVDGLDAYTALKVLSETGADMSPWPSIKHWTSWLGLYPGSHVSGGKSFSGRTKPCANKVATALRIAAQTLWHSKSALGAFLRGMKMRLGPAEATTATAHKLARIIYVMLKTKTPYHDLGEHYYEEQYRQRSLRNLVRRAKEFGFTLVQAPTPSQALQASGTS